MNIVAYAPEDGSIVGNRLAPFTEILHPYLSAMRADLKEEIRRARITRMTDLLTVTEAVIQRRHEELNYLKSYPLTYPSPIAALKGIALEGSLAKYNIHIPGSLYELIEVGKAMRNCLDDKAMSRRYVTQKSGIIILQEKVSQKPAFAAQVNSDGQIIEFKGRHNRIPSKEASRDLRTAIHKIIKPKPSKKRQFLPIRSNRFTLAQARVLDLEALGGYERQFEE